MVRILPSVHAKACHTAQPHLQGEETGDGRRLSKRPGDSLRMAEVSDLQAGRLKGKSVPIAKAIRRVS